MTYPGGKSGAGVYQRLINLIPAHRVLISAFAGRCGVARKIRPAEHTIVIDADADVCQWWDDWRRTPKGRALEIHHCDSLEWLRHFFGQTEYSAAGSGAARAGDNGSAVAIDDENRDAAATTRIATRPAVPTKNAATAAADLSSVDRLATKIAAEYFLFCDPPYVLSQRAHGKLYTCELSDEDHHRLLRILSRIPATLAAVMLCGYASPVYAACDRDWRWLDHQVPTRGGLQDERIWMNYGSDHLLHDTRYVGQCRRSRERIRRRQRNWLSQLKAMTDPERAAMLDVLNNFQTDRR